MEIYSTEEQQAEAIKRFFRENGVALIAGAVIGLGGLYGWKAYNQAQIETAETASDAYTEFLKQASQEGEISDASKQFLADYKESNYAVLAAFVASRKAVDNKDLTAAKEQLNWVLANTEHADLKAIATTRIARIESSQDNHDAALGLLNTQFPEAFKSQVEELKGDILLAKGDTDSARAAYQAAVDAAGEAPNALLQVKLDNLAVASTL